LNSRISQLETEVSSSNSRISTLRGKINSKDSAVDSERSRGYQYSQTIENNNNAIKKLQETQKKNL
jgi:peptidoglycan hydrolase CwlO-like protein